MNAQRVREFRHLQPLTTRGGLSGVSEWSWARKDAAEPPFLGAYAQLLRENDSLRNQLAHAQRMESLGRLLPGIVHDFNHLLTHIVGFTELSMACIGEGHVAGKNLAKVKEAGLKAASLTRKLLAHCRKEDAEKTLVDLSELVGEMGALFQRMIGDSIQVELSLCRRPAPVLVDAVQIEQMLMNLVVNAMDAMPDGGCVFLQTAQVDVGPGSDSGIAPGRYVSIAVEDTGEGMTPPVLERAFEPYFTTKTGGQGTGLGLYLVAAIVEAHGGHLRVTSEPGQGSHFLVYLPVVEPAGEPDEVGGEHRA